MLHIFISAAVEDIRPGSTGKPVPGYEACVLDEDGKPAPAGEVGRLAVRGPTGCRYLADPRQADYVLDGWNLTGDAYLIDEDGYFWYQARTDDMIISSGYNIAGPEVEAALMAHEAVKECAVVGAPDPHRGTIVKAFVVLREPAADGDALAAELQDFVKLRIAPYKYPRAIDFVAALPRTETGKVQRFRLRQQELDRAGEGGMTADGHTSGPLTLPRLRSGSLPSPARGEVYQPRRVLTAPLPLREREGPGAKRWEGEGP